MEHDFTLTLADTGTVVDVFDRYDIILDMTRPGSPWSFTLWRSNGGADGSGEGARELPATSRRTGWEALLDEAKEGGQVVFAIDGAPQLNGRITNLNIVGTRQGGEAVVLSGRDLAGLAMDGEADPRLTLRNRPLEECLRELFNRVGIQAVVLVTADAEREVRTRARGRPGARGATSVSSHRHKRVDLSHARPDETVWQVAESIIRKFGLMMWVAPNTDGPFQMSVVVDVPAYDSEVLFRFVRREQDGVLTPESNIIEREFAHSIDGVPTFVYAAGRAERGDQLPARHFVAYQNEDLARFPIISKPLPPQPRFLHSARARNPETARQEAMQAAADKMREWRTYRPVVQGHGQDVAGSRRIYAPNTMAYAYDRTGRRTILDEEMLIHRVQFSASRHDGQTTRLTLGTKGAIKLAPEAS